MLNRPLRRRTFSARNASSPTQLSRAATSLRKPDHAVPNDAALCQSRGERVQLSFFYSMPRVVNSITRTEAIQLDLGIIANDCCRQSIRRGGVAVSILTLTNNRV